MARNSNEAQRVKRRTSKRAKEYQSRKGVERDPRPHLKRIKTTSLECFQGPPAAYFTKSRADHTVPRKRSGVELS
ncbi:hypothetical protein E5D57_002888 [Metarhizium anisopliae]|nr:hypothetical protein E5D57_002888 [Metarhizium anisopliae]